MNPYEHYLEGRDPLLLMKDTPEQLRRLVESWRPEAFARRLGPDKWTAAEIVLHLSHTELAFGLRARMGLTVDGYLVQPFDQTAWVEAERPADGPASFRAYYAMRQLNLALFGRLTPQQRARTFGHPERGDISIDWIMGLLAGHDIHHARQLEQLGRQPAP